ncbi:MAG: exodeoxyribonuclease VII small subunit [Candidatus Zixiibacteriota bacterium]|nr:MAG: exodeoxyribonuclease VII small subunit [candidate division Zixibacteria bacterium]
MSQVKKHKDFESAIDRLEEITDLLESGDTTLEESIKLYSEGLEIAGFCNRKLSEAEKKIKVVTQNNESLIEEDFEQGEKLS